MGEDIAVSPGGLTVQTVLYGAPQPSVQRSAEALATAVTHARQAHDIDRWYLHIGDCSAHPVVSDEDAADLDKIVGAAGGEVSVEWFGANLGHGGGQNRLLAKASTQHTIVVNPDALFAPDTIGRLLSSMAEGVGIVDARQIPLEHPKNFDPKTGETSWASLACALIDVELARSIGGFDASSFFMYCDDVDFSWRVRLAGKKVLHQPLARIFHDKRLSANSQIHASVAEMRYSAHAAMMLAHKYSRPDLAESIATHLAAHGDEHQRRAVQDFRRQQAAGELPAPIDADHRVAQFIDGEYAVHRKGTSA